MDHPRRRARKIADLHEGPLNPSLLFRRSSESALNFRDAGLARGCGLRDEIVFSGKKLSNGREDGRCE